VPNKSEHKGASEERQVILRKVTRMRVNIKNSYSVIAALMELENWIKSRVKRFRTRKGGL